MSSGTLTGKTILLADDERILTEAIARHFRRLGATVLTGFDGLEAWELLSRHAVDIVVTDAHMPGCDGLELVRRIRQCNCESPPIVILTGDMENLAEELHHLGAEALVGKPFQRADLTSTVERLLSPKDCWSASPPPCGKEVLHRSFAKIEDALSTGQLILGRGGAFIAEPGPLPPVNSVASFSFMFSDGPITSIEGSGVVRWSRQGANENLPRGFGLEFSSLSASVIEPLRRLIQSIKPKAFIPKK